MSRFADKLLGRSLDMDLVAECRRLGVPMSDLMLIAQHYGPTEANDRMRGTIATMASLQPLERIDLDTWRPS